MPLVYPGISATFAAGRPANFLQLGDSTVGLLDRITSVLSGNRQEGDSGADTQARARREAFYAEVMGEFADAEHIEPKAYHELKTGEIKTGRTPAIEYLANSAAVRLHHLLPYDLMRMAALVKAYGLRWDDLEEGELGEIIDLKPTDQPGIEHGAVNLGPVPQFRNARGTGWRFFIELSYTAVAAGGRGAIQVRRFIADCELIPRE
jgi:hypothetical protein